VNGHVIAEVGRYRSDRDRYGPCKACNREAVRKHRRRRADYVRALKLERGCMRCGYARSAAALDFHHRDPSLKKFSISQAITRPWDAVLSEIEKCDVICRNCHAELHEGEDR
jgi:hypothetical protein